MKRKGKPLILAIYRSVVGPGPEVLAADFAYQIKRQVECAWWISLFALDFGKILKIEKTMRSTIGILGNFSGASNFHFVMCQREQQVFGENFSLGKY